VLEHIENLDTVFKEVSHAICSGGYVYIGEGTHSNNTPAAKPAFTQMKGSKS